IMRQNPTAKRLKPLPITGEQPSPPSSQEIKQAVDGYLSWLDRQPLSPATRRRYQTRALQSGDWLASTQLDADPLTDSLGRDYAVRDFKGWLKQRKYSPATVNLAMAALDSFYRHLGLGSPQVRRETLPAQSPRALSSDEQKSLLRALERRGQPR